MRHRCPVRVALVAGTLALPGTGWAQQFASATLDTARIDTAALDTIVAGYVRGMLTSEPRVGFDAVLPTPRRAGAVAPRAPAGDQSARARRVARALRGRAVRSPDVFSCGALPSSCRLRTVDVIVHWAPAAVAGDSATATLYVVRATGDRRVPIQQLTQEVLLVRRAGAWRVGRARTTRVT